MRSGSEAVESQVLVPLSDGQTGTGVPAPVVLMGVGIHPVSSDQLIELLVEWGGGTRQRHVYNVNAHAMNLSVEDRSFSEALQAADLVYCDGYGVKWASGVPYRLTPPDWIDAFARATALAGQPVFALGDAPGVAARFQDALASRHQGYLSAGSHHGFFNKSGSENDAVIEQINSSGAVHLLVGFGMPLQEAWLQSYGARLRARVLLPVGALYRWYTGVDSRAPAWMTGRGLEWLPRLMRHPRKHFRRYVIGNPKFVFRALRSRLRGHA